MWIIVGCGGNNSGVNSETNSNPIETPKTSSPTSSPTGTPTSPAVLEPTDDTPWIDVSVDINCRTGPGQDYDIIGTLLVGEKGWVVGVPAVNSPYYIIKNPDGGPDCWVWLEHGTLINGTVIGLPQVANPPTPTPNAIGTIQGHVYNWESLNGSVNIRIEGQGDEFSTATDDEGNFIISNIPPGLVTLKAVNNFSQTIWRDIVVIQGEITIVELQFDIALPTPTAATPTP